MTGAAFAKASATVPIANGRSPLETFRRPRDRFLDARRWCRLTLTTSGRESRHVDIDMLRQPIAFARGARAPGRRRRPRDLRPRVWHRRGVLGLHPGLAAAIADQHPRFFSLIYTTRWWKVAARLTCSGLARVFFSTATLKRSSCLKFARRCWFTRASMRAPGSWPSRAVSRDARWARSPSPGMSTTARRSSRCWDRSRSSHQATSPRSKQRSPIAPRRSSPNRSRAKAASGRCRASSLRRSRPSAGVPGRS